jgi:hypothetical protein
MEIFILIGNWNVTLRIPDPIPLLRKFLPAVRPASPKL